MNRLAASIIIFMLIEFIIFIVMVYRIKNNDDLHGDIGSEGPMGRKGKNGPVGLRGRPPTSALQGPKGKVGIRGPVGKSDWERGSGLSSGNDYNAKIFWSVPESDDWSTIGVCELGCNRCGYNWYKQHWNNGNPTQWWNRYCGCCGGTQAQQNVCKRTCI